MLPIYSIINYVFISFSLWSNKIKIKPFREKYHNTLMRAGFLTILAQEEMSLKGYGWIFHNTLSKAQKHMVKDGLMSSLDVTIDIDIIQIHEGIICESESEISWGRRP